MFFFIRTELFLQTNSLSKIQEVTPHISVIYCCGSAWWWLYALNCCPATKRLFTESALLFMKHYFLSKRQQGTWSWDNAVVPASRLRIGHLRNRSIPGRCKRRFSTPKRPDRRCGATRLLSMGTDRWWGRGAFPGNDAIGMWSWLLVLIRYRGQESVYREYFALSYMDCLL